jgi:cysteine desulfurase/selenocysteine lyase
VDIESLRKDFPLLTKPINGKKVCYFDNAATSLKPQSVIDAISDYYLHYSANPGRGEYDSAFQTYKKVEEARENIAKFLNAESEEVVFTSGTTMSINLIAQGYGLHHLTENDEILITEADHSANTLPWYHVAKITRAKLIIIPLEKEQRLTETILLKYINKKMMN